ncbi:MAG: GNAT family N-acetyltransferase, partial [Oscillospiraceae bacterium]
MQIKVATIDELRRIYATDLVAAFPPEELKPLSAMERLMDEGRYLPLLLTENEHILGQMFVWLGPENYGLIDYLAVNETYRNGGLGAKLLELAFAAYPQLTFLGEAEAPTGDPARDAMILRRLGFYTRAGAKWTGYEVALFGVRFRTFYWAPQPIADEALLPYHQTIYRRQFTESAYARYIQIPLRNGDVLP